MALPAAARFAGQLAWVSVSHSASSGSHCFEAHLNPYPGTSFFVQLGPVAQCHETSRT